MLVMDEKCTIEKTSWKKHEDDDGPSNCNPEHLVYDRTLMSSTLIEEFQLVCDRSNLRAIVNIMYMIGCLVGCYLFGWISDAFGRIKPLMLGILLVSLAGLGGPSGVYAIAALHLVCGVGAIACFMVSFVLIVEHVEFKYSYMLGLLIYVAFALGEVLLDVEAYFIRDWKTL